MSKRTSKPKPNTGATLEEIRIATNALSGTTQYLSSEEFQVYMSYTLLGPVRTTKVKLLPQKIIARLPSLGETTRCFHFKNRDSVVYLPTKIITTVQAEQLKIVVDNLKADTEK
jgi:hypothetical protein